MKCKNRFFSVNYLFYRGLFPLLGVMLFGLGVLLVSCGGDGGGGDQTESTCYSNRDCESGKICKGGKCVTPKNTKPIADAGTDQKVRVGETVYLDGSNSYDPDGDNITYKWSFSQKPEGSKAELTGETTPTPSFVADKVGIYVVELVISDGKETAKDDVTIEVEKGINNPPTAKITGPEKVPTNQKVTLDGSQSKDPDGDKLQYQWALTPPNGSKAALDDPKGEKVSFTPDIEGKYRVTLKVSDGELTSAEAVLEVEAIEGFDKKPVLDKLDPDTVPNGTLNKISLYGQSFVKGAVVLFKSREYKVTYKSDKELEVELNLVGVSPGKYPVVVKNPNGQKSNPKDLTVIELPQPVITQLDPPKAGTGAKFTLLIRGKGFVKSSEAFFTSQKLKVVYKNDGLLEADLDLTGIAPGVYPVMVRNPGGKSSAPFNFEVTQPPPPPEITILNPERAKSGTKVKFTVFGKRFNKGSKILFDGKEIPTKFISNTELQADPELDLTNVSPGSYQVQVRDRFGFTSKGATFTVLDPYPPPKLTALLPNSGIVGSKVKVQIRGTNFDKKSEVYFDGAKVAKVVYKSDSQLEAEFDLSGKIPNKQYGVYATNPGPPGKNQPRKSNTLLFKVLPLPPPYITRIVTSPLYSNNRGVIEVIGRGFTPGAVVQFSSTATSSYYCRRGYSLVDRPTTYIDSTRLRAVFTMPMVRNYYSRYFSLRVKRGSSYSNIVCVSVSSSQNPPTPSISRLDPPGVLVGSTSPVTVKIYGSYFERFSAVYFDKKKLSSPVYRSSSLLEVKIDISKLKAGSSYEIYVENSTGKTSNRASFTILKKGQPLLSGVTPTRVYAGDVYTLTLTGKGFDPKATVTAGGKAISGQVVYNSSTSITVKNAVFSIQQKGSLPIAVVNPGGISSNPINITVQTYPAPKLTSMTPNKIEEGSTLSFYLYGSYFKRGASVILPGNLKFPCQYYSSSRLRCENVDFSALNQGTHPIKVENPDSQQSNTITFSIVPPTPPSISSISPATGYNNQTVTINVRGSRFNKNSVFYFDGTPQKTTFVSTTQLKADVDLKGRKQGFVSVFVRNVIKGKNYDSNKYNFTILEPPPPLIEYFKPMSAPAGQTVSITIYGKEFNKGTQVLFNGNAQTVKSFSSTSITFDLDLSKLQTGKYSIQLVNGQKKSSTVYFSVLPSIGPKIFEVRPAGTYQSSAPVSVTIYGKNFSPKATVSVKGNKIVVQSITSTQIKFAIPFPYPLFQPNAKNEIKVTNPDGKSAVGYIYTMPSGVPVISYISPRTTTVGRRIYIYAYGSSLYGSTLYIDGKSVSSYSYSSYVRTRSTYSVGTTPRNIEIKLQKYGKFSNPVYLKVEPNPAPEITYIQPPYGKLGNSVTVTVYGRNFRTPSVLFGGKSYKPTSWRSSSLTVTLPLTNLTAGAKELQVKNSDGQVSQKVFFNVEK